MLEQLEKLRAMVLKEAGLVECCAFGHLVRLGVVSWEMLGEMLGEMSVTFFHCLHVFITFIHRIHPLHSFTAFIQL